MGPMSSPLAAILAKLQVFSRVDPQRQVAAAGNEPPRDLPESLRLVYRHVAMIANDATPAAPYGTQDHLLPYAGLKRIDDQVEFAWENQGNWSARFVSGQADPPVLSNAADVYATPARGFVVVGATLSHFLTTFMLQEAALGAAHVCCMPEGFTADALPALRLAPIWLDGRYLDEQPTHDFWLSENAEVLLFKHRHEGVFAATHAASAVSQLLAVAGSRPLRGAAMTPGSENTA